MTLPAELRAEADRRVPGVNAYYHDEPTRALLQRAADALEVTELRVVAKRNLRSMIDRGSSDRELMLKCLEELS